MEILKFDTEKNYGKFKLMNGTNGGPLGNTHTNGQGIYNFEEYKAARIPYARNHDSNISATAYGGPFVHDISAIFPNFDADPEAAENYQFENTDEDIKKMLNCGTKCFYRLGQSIEHQIRKINVWPPKDYKKWAVICEHIIRHYTEGWANGFKYDMPYWEIWNEPDMANEETDVSKKSTWCGTDEQFYDFYEVAAKHLKACFPHLKIGGPGLCSRIPWADKFLCEMQKRNVPIDFFSWHCYASYPEKLVEKGDRVKELLIKYGYENAESICGEYNYIKAWTGEGFVYSVKSHIGEKGAAFVMSSMTLAQHSSTDMLLVYDTRLGIYNNFFDYYTRKPIKGYYSLYWYGMLYDMDYEIRTENEIANIYSLCGVDKNGKKIAIITYYNDEEAEDKKIKLDFGKKNATYEIYAVSKEHNGELVAKTKKPVLKMPNYSFFLVKEK